MAHDLKDRLTQDAIARLNRNPEFDPFILKEYRHWTLYLDGRDQSLPGRAYAWLLRHQDRMSISELETYESEELRGVIVPQYEAAMRGLVPRLMCVNYEWLGNEVHMHRGHGHMHFIPRFGDGPFPYADRIAQDMMPVGRRANERLRPSDQELAHTLARLREGLGRCR